MKNKIIALSCLGLLAVQVMIATSANASTLLSEEKQSFSLTQPPLSTAVKEQVPSSSIEERLNDLTPSTSQSSLSPSAFPAESSSSSESHSTLNKSSQSSSSLPAPSESKVNQKEASTTTSSNPLLKAEGSTSSKTNEEEKKLSLLSLVTGKWGQSTYSFDSGTGVLTLGAGTTGTYKESPWNSVGGIDRFAIKRIKISPGVIANANSQYLFSDDGAPGLASVEGFDGLTNLDTSKVTNMRSMFDGCSSVTSLDVSKFNTIQATDMFAMFKNCSSLISLDVSKFDVSNVTRMRSMFNGCSSLISLALSKFDVSNVTDMGGMFNNCQSLKSIDLSQWKTGDKLTNVGTMFKECSSLTDLDVSKFDTSSVLYMDNFVNGCTNLRSLNLSSWNNGAVTASVDMFKGTSLSSLTLGANFKFKGDEALGAPYDGGLLSSSPKWTKSDGKSAAYTATDFMTKYGTGDLTAGTYVSSTPVWGTCPYVFDAKTGLLTIGAGTTGTYKESPWNSVGGVDRLAIKRIKISPGVIANPNSEFLFSGTTDHAGLANLECFDGLSNLNTSSVTSMRSMFDGATKLKSVDLSSFNTKNVTSMLWMFNACSSLKSLDLSKFDTANLITMWAMFQECEALSSLDLSTFNTSKVTDMHFAFRSCTNLRSLNLSSWNNGAVTSSIDMFKGTSLSSLTLGASFKFKGDEALGAPYDGGLLSSSPKWTKSDGKSAAYTATDFMAKYGTGDLTAGTYVSSIPVWGTCPYVFDAKTGLLTIGAGTTGTCAASPWNIANGVDRLAIKRIKISPGVIANTDSSRLFSGLVLNAGLSNLEGFDGINNLDTSQVTDMQYMFQGASKLTTIDLSKFNTSKVTTMETMFHNCNSLTSLDVSKFNTAQVTTMYCMFDRCRSLKNIDVSKFDVSKVTNLGKVFENCQSLKSIDLSQWKTGSKLTNVGTMFLNCSSLTDLDVSKFDTSSVLYMDNFVNGCTNLRSLNLSSWNNGAVTKSIDMFKDTSLSSLTLGASFKFKGDEALGSPILPEGATTGNWIRNDGTSKAYAPIDFMSKYGTGDLLPGTYVAEEAQATLDLKVAFDKASSKTVVGEDVSSIISIENISTSNTSATGLKLDLGTLYSSQLGGALKLPSSGTLTETDEKGATLSTKPLALEALISLPDLQKGHFYKLSFMSKAINNTPNTSTPNYSLSINYYSGKTLTTKKVSGIYLINNGVLSFKEVPDSLAFPTTKLSGNQLVKRSSSDWGFTVSDNRGTVPVVDGDNSTIARKDWDVVASASEFTDAQGQSVPHSALSLVFIGSDSTSTEITSDIETLINHHAVNKETPELNKLTTISWNDTQGFQVKLNNYRQVKQSSYKAQLSLDLRQAP